MKQRCLNPNTASFKNYGGRGIKLFPEWEIYENFLRDVGRRPTQSHQIERIDNNGNYEPSNVRWALPREQMRNKRSNNNVTVNGVTKCVTDWAKALEADPGTVSSRIDRGWSPEDAVTIPTEKHVIHEVTARGETHTIFAWSRISGNSPTTITHRLLKRGWSPEDAIFSKPGSKGVGRPSAISLTASGKTLSLEEWSKETGIGRTTLEARLQRGWTPERTVTTPPAPSPFLKRKTR